MDTKDKKARHKALTFTLRNINPRQLEERYGITLESNLQTSLAQPKGTTSIDGLSLNNNDTKTYSYVDESKKTHRCLCIMHSTEGTVLPNKTSCSCWWCKHQFSSMPIGVPLKYIPSQTVKTYYSEITKDNYTIRENISNKKRKVLESEPDPNIKIIKNEYYVTDGLFCSFNCALAYIEENEHVAEYQLSRTLLIKIYEDLFQQDFNIFSAPNWKLLQQYGGNLTIDEFRDQFNKVEYMDLNNRLFNTPKCYGSGKLYEQKIKF